MAGVLAGLMGLGAAGLATLALIWLAWPTRLLGLFAWIAGRQQAWDEGRISEADEAMLLSMAARMRGVVLALLFAWSFAAGAALSWARAAVG